jgi:hypothetical protein
VVELTVEGVGLPPIRENESDEEYQQRLRAEDDARMRKEVLDDEVETLRLEEELQARQAAEEAVAKERRLDAARRKIQKASDQHEYLKRVSALIKQLPRKDAERVQHLLGAVDNSRRLCSEGLLSKTNDEEKRLELVQNIGRSYFMLFSDTMLFLSRESKAGGQTFKLERIVDQVELSTVRLTSHAFDSSAAERRGITLSPLNISRSKVVSNRANPYRLYAPSGVRDNIPFLSLGQCLMACGSYRERNCAGGAEGVGARVQRRPDAVGVRWNAQCIH